MLEVLHRVEFYKLFVAVLANLLLFSAIFSFFNKKNK